MGSVPSTQSILAGDNMSWRGSVNYDVAGGGGGRETVAAALTRLDEEISGSEKSYPEARLAVVTAELDSLRQEIASFEETTTAMTNRDAYAKTLHQLFTSMDLYRRPILASENEDFIANVNRKEMRKLELAWLKTRNSELLREKQVLHAQILRTRSLYAQLQALLESIWGNSARPGANIESSLSRARALRDALSAVSARLRAAADYAHAALRSLDAALPVWKLGPSGKSGWSRVSTCAEVCSRLVAARCQERGARRVLSARAAPRASRALRLALDYAHTDHHHPHKHERATEIFMQFKESLVQLVNSIHQVLLNNLENLAMAEKDVARYRRDLRGARINALAQDGLAELQYRPRAMNRKK